MHAGASRAGQSRRARCISPTRRKRAPCRALGRSSPQTVAGTRDDQRSEGAAGCVGDCYLVAQAEQLHVVVLHLCPPALHRGEAVGHLAVLIDRSFFIGDRRVEKVAHACCAAARPGSNSLAEPERSTQQQRPPKQKGPWFSPAINFIHTPTLFLFSRDKTLHPGHSPVGRACPCWYCNDTCRIKFPKRLIHTYTAIRHLLQFLLRSPVAVVSAVLPLLPCS